MKKSKKSKARIQAIRPVVFEMAAQAIADGSATFACNAIKNIQHTEGIPTRRELWYFTKLLKPKGIRKSAAWYSDESVYFHRTKTARVLGLLFCARLAKEKFNPWA